MFGFLNIYKPHGITSHDVISILRKITNIKQIGHTGTLDPFAEGVLPICIGKSTKLIEYLNSDKAYIGTVKLGTATDTYDKEGTITNTSSKIVTKNEILNILKIFQGTIYQNPPIYSAIKIKGKKLYEYARAGETVDIKPREINITKLEVSSFETERQELELIIECSKGTYIRSLANDIGEKLGTYGHLIKLIRVKTGDFKVENSIRLENIKTIDDVNNNLQNPLNYLHYPKYEINSEEYKFISNGNPIKALQRDGTIILTQDNKVIGVGKIQQNILKPCKIFI